MNNDP